MVSYSRSLPAPESRVEGVRYETASVVAQRMADGDDLPPQFAGEAKQMNAVLTDLLAAPESLDWIYFSPAAQFGAFAPGEARGTYRVGGDVAFFDADGTSAISGADFALAIVDEIERPAHRRAQVSIAY